MINILLIIGGSTYMPKGLEETMDTIINFIELKVLFMLLG